MAKRKRALAALTIAWTLAAAGMAAFALSSAPIDGDAASQLADVQVGERENQTRIALICEGGCRVEKRGNEEFILHGASAELSLDLSDRVDNLKTFTATPTSEGAILRVVAVSAIEFVNTKSCTIGGRAASCIDFFFDDVATVAAVQSTARNEVQNAPSEPAIRTTQTSAPPALRETASARFTQFAKLSPPERLTPPSATLAKVQPVRPEDIPDTTIATPTLRSETLGGRKPKNTKEDFATRVRSILGKELSSDYCLQARDTLQDDPWALDAMVDVGLCSAAKGDMTGAEDILSRLLEYTPDNYEAYVGRALIASHSGEKSVARRYFQNALDALPPIEESNRIVQAMKSL